MMSELALFALTLGSALLPAGGASPRVAAHRGGALLWLENSLAAYRNALALGVDDVETDVHLTADGEVVVLHDATLDRTTSGTGAVGRTRRVDLMQWRLRAPDGSLTEEPIPALGDLLEIVAPSRAGLLLEIKVDERGRRYPGIEERVLALLGEHGLARRTLIMAFEPATLRRVRDLDATVRTVLLVERGGVGCERVAPGAAVARAVDLGAAAVGVDHRLIDVAMAPAARRARLLLAAWTVNAEADLRRAIGLGVDIVISDRPDLALRVVGR
jgi:glycerophosphoryl diester phosphodiesterase